MAVKFLGPGVTKQNRLIIAPQVPTEFEDEHAEDYFIAMGWAEETNETPVVTYPEGSVEIHPLTVYADGDKKGQYVLPARATAHLAESETPAPAEQEA